MIDLEIAACSRARGYSSCSQA